MPKGKKNDELELDFGDSDEREFKGSDANPIDAATGESLFDDLNPRFTRQLDSAAAAAEGGKRTARVEDDEDLDPADEELDPLDEELDEEEDPDQDEPRKTEGEDLDPADEDEDEPRPGRKPTAIERRVARSNRLLEETRAQLTDLQQRERDRENRDKLTASEAEFNEFRAKTNSKLDELKAKKAKAIEDGDTAAQVDLDDQITDLKAELSSKRNEHEAAKKAVEESSKRRGASQITLIKVAQWKRKNPRYQKDQEFAAAVNGIDQALVANGSNPESDEHYKEIDRRIRKLFPGYGEPRKQRRHPSQQMAREESPSQRRPPGDARVTVRGGKIKISATKLARVKENMARFGLDPTNKKDLQDYILNNPGL